MSLPAIREDGETNYDKLSFRKKVSSEEQFSITNHIKKSMTSP